MSAQFQDLLHSMVDASGTLRMQAVVRYASVAIDGADHAAISLSRRGREPKTVYSSGELPLKVDALQYQLDEGPCVAAMEESDLVWINDLEHDRTYPRFAPGAVDLGVRSMLSSRLFLTPDDRAAFNLYSERARAFDQSQLPLAAIFASYASLILINALQEDQVLNLERALKSNREIGVAVGILMAQEHCTEDEAFRQLAEASQKLNRRLRDIAAEVRSTGELPAS